MDNILVPRVIRPFRAVSGLPCLEVSCQRLNTTWNVGGKTVEEEARWGEKRGRRRRGRRKQRVDDEKEIMGVLLVSRVTARFLRKFERSCRRGTSRQRVQKARPTSTLIRRCSLRVRTRLFLYLSILSLSLPLPSSLLARVIFLLHSSDFLHFRRSPWPRDSCKGKVLFPFSFFDSSCELQASRCSGVKIFT